MCDSEQRRSILGGRVDIAGIYNRRMATKSKAKPKGPWTAEEIARNERVAEARIERDKEMPIEERLEETLRLSRFISELRQGVPDDVRAR
jgi:hypothetical protein